MKMCLLCYFVAACSGKTFPIRFLHRQWLVITKPSVKLLVMFPRFQKKEQKKGYYHLMTLNADSTQYYPEMFKDKLRFIMTTCLSLSFVHTFTNWGRDKITHNFFTLWNAFTWMRMYEFRSRFLWIWLLRAQLTILQHNYTHCYKIGW